MFCEQCGKKFGVDAKFCGGCGAVRETGSQSPAEVRAEQDESLETSGTSFDIKVQILADLWLACGDDPEWQDFTSTHSLSLPLAFMLAWGPVPTESIVDAPGEELIEETFEALLLDGDISEDTGFEDIIDVFNQSDAWTGDDVAVQFVKSLATRTLAMTSSSPPLPRRGSSTPANTEGNGAAGKRKTPLATRVEILADYWITYQDEEEEFLEFHCVGLPLAYMLANDYLDTESVADPSTQELIDQTFDLLLKHWGFPEDTGFQHVDEIQGVGVEMGPDFIKYITAEALKLKNNGE